MKKFYNKFLIISTIFLLVGGVYLYISKESNGGTIVPIAFGSSLASSNGGEVSPITPTMGNDIASDISFLTTLVSLKQIKIDTSLFINSSFNKLQNNAVKLEPVVAGRVNPFAPMDANSNTNTSGQTVITDQPAQITDKTAILNGTINTTNGVTDTYFQYGLSAQDTPNTTGLAKQSLVGTFVKNISGLTTKTTYFFKACAKINNIALCGEVISFTTK